MCDTVVWYVSCNCITAVKRETRSAEGEEKNPQKFGVTIIVNKFIYIMLCGLCTHKQYILCGPFVLQHCQHASE